MEDSKPGAEMPLLGAYEYSFSINKFIRFFGPGLLMSIAYIVGTSAKPPPCPTPGTPPMSHPSNSFHSSHSNSSSILAGITARQCYGIGYQPTNKQALSIRSTDDPEVAAAWHMGILGAS
jgi:hypothetical protein